MSSNQEERISALEALVEELTKRVEELEKKKPTSSKSTPKKISTPLTIEEILEKLPDEVLCTHYFSSGQNKGKFCSAPAKVINNNSIDDFLKENSLDKKFYATCKCSKHAVAKKNNNQKIFDNYWGIKVEKTKVSNEVSTVDETVANILGGNAEGITTPTAAKNKKVVLGDEYEIDEKFYSTYKIKDGFLVYQYKKKKDGTPSNRPSPVVIGKLEDKPDEGENFLDRIIVFDEEEYESELRALNMKYSPIKDFASEKPERVEPEVKGLVLPTVKSEKPADDYTAETETDGDIDDLLNSI